MHDAAEMWCALATRALALNNLRSNNPNAPDESVQKNGEAPKSKKKTS
jgi:hypothetical protein